MDFLGGIDEVTGRRERKEGFEKLKNQLQALRAEPVESNMMRYFDFISWVESKLIGKSFSEVVADNFQKRSN